MKNEKNTMKAGTKIAIGAGMAALAAAGAGAYFLFGTKAGKKKQKEITSWMHKAEGEVLKKMKNLKEINEEVYNKVISEVTAKYKAMKEVDISELETLSKHLRNQWKNVKRAMDAHPKK